MWFHDIINLMRSARGQMVSCLMSRTSHDFALVCHTYIQITDAMLQCHMFVDFTQTDVEIGWFVI